MVKATHTIIVLLYILLLLLILGCKSGISESNRLDTESGQQANKFMLSLPKSTWRTSYPELEGEVNVFVVDQEGTILEPLVSGLKGHNFVEDVSPEGQLLVSSFPSIEMRGSIYGDLYIFDQDGANPVLLTDKYMQMFGSPISSAMWLLSRDEVVFIAAPEGQPHIFVSSLDGQNIKRISAVDETPSIFSPLYFEGQTKESFLYWRNGIWNPPIINLEQAIWSYDFEKDEVNKITSEDQPFPDFAFSSTNDNIVLSNEAGHWLVDSDFQFKQKIPVSGVLQGISWSPSGKYLLVQVAFDDPAENRGELYLWEVGQPLAARIDTMNGLSIASWSPDERNVALSILGEVNGSPMVSSLLLDIPSRVVAPLFANLNLTVETFSHIFWSLHE